MNFTSQICTTKEQSERLLALGLKKETADMAYEYKPKHLADTDIDKDWVIVAHSPCGTDIPAWSLHRLLELFIEVNGHFLDWEFEISPGKLIISRSNRMMFVWSKNVYDSIITCIEWLIKSGYFNKDYLEE